jgi:hypothetical protein
MFGTRVEPTIDPVANMTAEFASAAPVIQYD